MASLAPILPGEAGELMARRSALTCGDRADPDRDWLRYSDPGTGPPDHRRDLPSVLGPRLGLRMPVEDARGDCPPSGRAARRACPGDREEVECRRLPHLGNQTPEPEPAEPKVFDPR